MKKILRTKYEKYQSEIRSLCLQLGLVEHNNGSITEFRTEYDTSFIYGEVIRLFDYDSMYYNKYNHTFSTPFSVKTYFLK